GSPSSTDLCGGRLATAVPTAISVYRKTDKELCIVSPWEDQNEQLRVVGFIMGAMTGAIQSYLTEWCCLVDCAGSAVHSIPLRYQESFIYGTDQSARGFVSGRNSGSSLCE
ncbi:MAG TPA: hypothetical protein PLR25_25135, partial [Planctomycetaceae bacterium]|nr:hypothetical protein [Planctomycetaceae bacterium]